MSDSVRKALDILYFLSTRAEPTGIGPIIDATGISKATAYRLIRTLESNGWVISSGSPHLHEASLRVWELGVNVIRSSRIRNIALPHAIELARACSRLTGLAVLERDGMIFTDSMDVFGEHITQRLLNTRVHPLVTAAGRAIFAFRDASEVRNELLKELPRLTPHTKTADEIVQELELAKQRGFAAIDREYNPEGWSVAVPIRASSGLALAAYFVNSSGALAKDTLETLLPMMHAAARKASDQLGFEQSGPILG
jgi:DNA-binding IclR family transcriptional regulator